MIEDDLVAQIAAAPDDAGPYLVYADWLQQRGDPRGQLIVLQATGAPEAEQRALIDAHLELRGPDVGLDPAPAIAWEYGYWRRLELGAYGWAPDDRALAGAAAFAGAPSARFLRELSIRARTRDAAATALAIARARRGTLHALSAVVGRGAFDDASLRALAACTRLRALELFACNDVTAAGLAHLSALRELARLDLRQAPLDDAGAAALRGLPLRDVSFDVVRDLTPVGVRALAAAPLERLRLAGLPLRDMHAAALAGHATLAAVDLAGAPLDEVGCRALAALPALRELSLAGSPLSPAATRALADAPGLRALDLGHSEALADDAIAPLAALRELRALDLGATAVTASGLRALRGLPLRALDVSFRPLRDAGARELLAFPQLEQLALGWTDVTDATVDVLLELPHLTRVDLAASKVTQMGIARLAAHPSLRTVGLYECDTIARARASAHSAWTVVWRDALAFDLR